MLVIADHASNLKKVCKAILMFTKKKVSEQTLGFAAPEGTNT
jgi:hypothetical protein